MQSNQNELTKRRTTMATKKQAETQKAKEQCAESMNKLSDALRQVVDIQQLQHKYYDLQQDYLELAASVQVSAANTTRVILRHNISRTTYLSQGEVQKTNA
jgi:Flp pilus assembly protein CpaB